jgi:hypothetical protein
MNPLAESYFKDQELWIADFARRSVVIKDKVFEDCQIFGPAVLAPFNPGTFDDCSWAEAADPEAVLWEVDPDRETYVGAIGLENCVFRRCHFARVGILVTPDEYRRLTEDTIEQ